MCVCVCVGVSVWSIRFFNDGQRGIARSFTRFVPGRKKIRGVGGAGKGGGGGGRRFMEQERIVSFNWPTFEIQMGIVQVRQRWRPFPAPLLTRVVKRIIFHD